eukprot:3431241-Pyramimonas_sp.AAC.2
MPTSHTKYRFPRSSRPPPPVHTRARPPKPPSVGLRSCTPRSTQTRSTCEQSAHTPHAAAGARGPSSPGADHKHNSEGPKACGTNGAGEAEILLRGPISRRKCRLRRAPHPLLGLDKDIRCP